MEAAERIALPMISFAGRRLAVLATPPQTFGAEDGTRTRDLDVGNIASLPLDDFRPLINGEPMRAPGKREQLARVQQRSVVVPSNKWSEQRELNSRHRVGSPRHGRYTMLALKKSWRGRQDSNLLELVLETSALPVGSSPPHGGRNGSRTRLS